MKPSDEKLKLTLEGSGKTVDPYTEEGARLISDLWLKVACYKRYMYEPSWMGIPIIQFPDDIMMMHELLWKVRPDVIIETGVAHGGTAVFYASMLELMGRGKVIGVDVEIRKYNRVAIQSHPMSKRIELIEGSSTDAATVAKVREMIPPGAKVLVTLDSNHSYKHVLNEMELYNGFVSKDSYLVAMDGAQGLIWDTPMAKPGWREDNPLTAIHEFLKKHSEWEIDPYYTRMGVTSNPCGYLRRKPSVERSHEK